MSPHSLESGPEIFALMERLWPICRSLTGNGVRETLAIIQGHLPALTVHEVPTGTRCFDWTVPEEWNIRDAFVEGPDGSRVIDFARSNLHVVGYSEPVDTTMDLSELDARLHSLPGQPDAIPFVTSYFKRTWGFCVSDRVRRQLRPGRYRVRIDSELNPGSLTYGELRLPGRSDRELFFSTYICHPSMANNELSGPCVTTALAAWLADRDRHYSYRFIFVPETLGALCYLSRHLAELKSRMLAGFVMTCLGDDRAWSLMPSRNGQTLADRAARRVLRDTPHTEYSFLERGSDERQYCSPGIDLPVASIMRSKYMTYPEYHTSLDNLALVTPTGLGASLEMHQRLVDRIETASIPVATILGEPKMSDRGLRPTLGTRGLAQSGKVMMHLLVYADGSNTIDDIAELVGVPVDELQRIADELASHGLLRFE